MFTLEEAITAVLDGTPVEIPYRTRRGCRGLARRVETQDYWITLSVSEKPTKAWLDRLVEEVFREDLT